MRLSTPCLAVREARRHPAFENAFDQRPCGVPVHHFVRARFVESVIKPVVLILHIFRHVHFCLWLTDLCSDKGDVKSREC